MTVLRTPDVDVNKDFEAYAEITKAYVDERTGKRHIVGVATGVAEDRDGERVSKAAIVGMGRKIQTGVVKVTSSHQQDWMTEIGDVVKYDYDAETDEMIVDGVLPAEGVDAIADKAWRTANTEKVGWSIGGKLLKAYHERNELGKKRKVLDAIDLRHVMLTKHPAYPHSFAEAVVAKTFTGDEPDDDEFTIEVDDADVAKDTTTGSWASGDSDSGAGVGRDSVGSGQRNAGQHKKGGMSTEEDGSSDDDQDLPQAKGGERHLACPNCGHEFAADLPLNPEERQVDETGDDNEPDNDEDKKPNTGKSRSELVDTLTETLDALKALAAEVDVTKTDDKPAEAAVEKTVTPDGPSDVEKMVAASHKAQTDRIDELETKLGNAFELIAKSHQGIVTRLDDMPRGRQSVARVLPPSTGHDETDVEKSTEQLIAETDDPIAALKIQNERTWGVRDNQRGVLA